MTTTMTTIGEREEREASRHARLNSTVLGSKVLPKVVMPVGVARLLGLKQGDTVNWDVKDDEVIITKKQGVTHR